MGQHGGQIDQADRLIEGRGLERLRSRAGLLGANLSLPAIWKMQGDFDEMQGGGKPSPANTNPRSG
jgi:hypothetical protein